MPKKIFQILLSHLKIIYAELKRQQPFKHERDRERERKRERASGPLQAKNHQEMKI